jgi:hypothetical protein
VTNFVIHGAGVKRNRREWLREHVMIWLVVLGLAVWLFVEHGRVTTLRRELESALRIQATAPSLAPVEATAPIPASPPPIVQPTPLVAQPATRVAEPAPVLPPVTFQPRPLPASPVRAPAPPRPAVTRAAVEAWLSEKGLAWVGGSALVIGGAFLVGYAVQQGFFTPAMRIGAAVLLGIAMLGAGEAIRRRRLAGFGGHKLAAAIVSGGGAAVLYGAAWAAYGLYGFISGPECAVLLTVIAAGLMGLALVHGEALAILALGGAFAAPLIAGRTDWTIETLTAYLGILVAAGAAIAWLRRWRVAAWANLAGAAIWSLLAGLEQDSLKCLLLGLEPLAATTALAYLRPRQPSAGIGLGVVLAASLASLCALTLAYTSGHPLTEGLLSAVALTFCAAALLRRGQVPAEALAAPGVAFTMAAVVARLETPQTLMLTALWCVQILALNLASLWGAWKDEQRNASCVGALASLALALAAGAGMTGGWIAPIGPAVACIALCLATWRLAADRSRPRDQLTLDVWAGSAAAALLATIAVGLSWRWAAFAFAAAALGLAFVGRRLAWRSVLLSSAAAGALALATLLTPGMLTFALGGPLGAAWILGAGLVVAVVSFVAARIVAKEAVAAETLRTLSPLAALVGAFIFLRWVAGAPQGLPLDALTEASVRTVLIAAAGLASLARLGQEATPFARWRGHVLMGAAAVHGLLLQVLLYNPRWSPIDDTAGGVIFLNSLAAAYLAPAVVFGLAAARTYRANRTAGRTYSLIALFSGLLWVFLEIRRMAQGPHLGGDMLTVGIGEALACSLVLLALAVAADRARRLATAAAAHPIWADITRSLPVGRAVAIIFTLYMAGFWSNPCWGATAQPFVGLGGVLSALAGYALVVPLTAWLALDAWRADRRIEAELAGYGAVLMGLVFATLADRALFHGADLTWAGGASQLETWSYSAVWAAMGLAFICVSGAGRRLFLRAGLALLLVTTAKVFILDTASLSGVVRAGSFLALGVLLLLGALTARRIRTPTSAASDRSVSEGPR